MTRRAAFAVLLALAQACASAPRPGPTPDGIAVAVPARDKAAARRQAVESLFPLFLAPAARREKAPALDKAVLGSARTMKSLIGRQKTSKRDGGVVEVRIGALSAALQGAGLIRPPGYGSEGRPILLALGDRSAGLGAPDRLAADALETALFGRGIQAIDADDQLVKLARPLAAKTEAGIVAEAAAGGWGELATGRAFGEARREAQSDSWRGLARYSLALYGVDRSTSPARIDAAGESLDVSSFSAVARAIEAAAQDAAQRVDAMRSRARGGRATIAILLSGYKDPGFIGRLLADLRRIDGVEAAALVAWRDLDGMTLLHAYAALTADSLAAKLLNSDPALRVTAVETEDGRLTVAGPDFPASADRGEDQ